MRKEHDSLGTVSLPKNAFYGIHSLRALQNFPDRTPFPLSWFKALGLVKLACYETYGSFKRKLDDSPQSTVLPITLIENVKLAALIASAKEVSQGLHYDQFIVPGISGGAGTSINMNMNEIITNRALQLLGHLPGEYQVIDPIEHANIFQSTNDVIPSSLKVACMQALIELESSINSLREKVSELENTHRDSLRMGYTQMQMAVPSTWGKLFSAYHEALSRDWWRVSKCQERIKVLNLGGSAIGTGLTVPRFFIQEVTSTLKDIAHLPLARGENLHDATSNLDNLVEVHAIMKAHAVNLEKMVADLRLLSSDLISQGEVHIPPKQVGSSIMPGKINPVIPEYVISCTHQVYANDQIITSLASLGVLDLNAYLPLIGLSLLKSLELLNGCCHTIKENLLTGLTINNQLSKQKLFSSPILTTALIPLMGYHQAGQMAQLMKQEGLSIFAANKKLNLIPEATLEKFLTKENLLSMGFSVNDLLELVAKKKD